MGSAYAGGVYGGDPGVKGALALYAGKPVSLMRLRFKGRSVAEMRTEIETFLDPGGKCYYELLSYRPGDASHLSQKFTMMKAFGSIEAVLMMAQMEIVYVRGWHLEFGLGGIEDYEDRKKAAHAVAKNLFPEFKITKDEADAILMAVYGWRKENGVLQHGKKQGFIARPGTGIVGSRLSELG